eukprot:4072486-Karenia_brevis.AAC.1
MPINGGDAHPTLQFCAQDFTLRCWPHDVNRKLVLTACVSRPLAICIGVRHVPHDGDLDEQVSKLLASMQWVCEASDKNIATVNGCQRHINGKI